MQLRIFALAAAALLMASPASGQDLEPRFLSPAPVGMSFGILAYGYSFGNVLLDQSLPLEGVKARIHGATAAYAHSVGLFGRSAQVAVALPTAHATWRGRVAGTDSSTTRIGLGDPLVSLSVNLYGAPALEIAEYATYRPRTLVGMTVKVRVPVGQYDDSKFFNLGSNRWSFSPRLGVARYMGRFTVEGYGAAWFFTTNSNFFGGSRVSQSPIYALQAHASYTHRPGLWGAVSFGQSFGGSLVVDDVDNGQSQTNNRIGVTAAIPVSGRHSFKLAYTVGFSTRAGADFDTIVAAWQVRW
jgi:hypothetical protein